MIDYANPTDPRLNLPKKNGIARNLGQAPASKLSRRQLLKLMGSIVATPMFLTACTLTSVSSPQASSEPTPTAEQTELIFWGHDQHPLDLAAEGFVQKNPQIHWVSPHPAEIYRKIQTAMAAGTGCPDLFWAEALEAQTWGCQDLLTDLSDRLKPALEQYHPLKINESLIAKTNKYVGWPGDLGVSGWYYRQDKLQEAGYGNIDFDNYTWQDFCEMAAALKAKGLYAFAFPAGGWNPLFMFVLHQLGGTAVSQDGQSITVGDDKGIRAMQIIKQLWDAGGLDVDIWSIPYWSALKEGKLLGDFAAAWARGFWETQLGQGGESSGIEQWRIAKFPTGAGIKYRTGVWVSSQLVSLRCGKNVTDAVNFMQYALGSLEGATRCGKWGIIPAYRPYLAAKDFLDLRSPLFGEWAFDEFWAGQEQELSTEYYRPAGWGAVNDVINTEMVSILKDEENVEDGMKRIVDIATPDFERSKCS